MDESQQPGGEVLDEPPADVDQYSQTPELDVIEWSASEYISHPKNTSWYIGLGAAAAVMTIVIFVITHNLLSALVVAMACMAVGVFAARTPATKRYRLSEDGVQVDDKFFAYANFKSFSVMDEGAINCIWLRPIRRFLPTIAMYFAPVDEDRIAMMLENFLPEEDRTHDLIDRAVKKIRF